MRNLLSANFLRLRKSRVFWLCAAYMLFDGLRLFYNATKMIQQGTSRYAPSFQLLFFGGIVFALYCSFFIGNEYWDGAIRNKLMSGASRTEVYLANLITCTAACLVMCAAYILPNWTLEYFLVGANGGLLYNWTPEQVALLLVEMIFVIVSFNSIFLMLGMNIQRKAVGPVVIFLAAAALIYYGHSSRTMLLLHDSSPEHWNLSPLAMLRCKLFAEWLPGGQGLHCVDMGSFWAPEAMILHSLIVIILSTVAGMLLFHRKDLR